MLDNWFCYLKSLTLRRKTRSKAAFHKDRRSRFRPHVEMLEDRWVPAGATVTNISSSGTGSLAYAVQQANSDTSGGPFTIQFDPTVFATPKTIALTGTLNLDTTTGESIIIDGPAAPLTIQIGELLQCPDFLVYANTIATIQNLTISTSNINLPGLRGDGGIKINQGGTLTVSDCTISGNSVGFSTGGGGIANDGMLSVLNSTISGNYGDSNGGAIWNEPNGNLTVSNSTISGNAAYRSAGGGIWNQGWVTVSSSTLSGNSAEQGGGIYNEGGTVTLFSTIVAGNLVAAGNYPDMDGNVAASSAYNLVGDGTGMIGISNGDANHNQVGTSTNPINPQLGPLQNNGRPTATMALLPGSPAISTGEIVNGITTDQGSTPTCMRQAGKTSLAVYLPSAGWSPALAP